jgi:hypothetical protein
MLSHEALIRLSFHPAIIALDYAPALLGIESGMECLVLNDILCKEYRLVGNILYTKYNQPYPSAYAARNFHGALPKITGTSSGLRPPMPGLPLRLI